MIGIQAGYHSQIHRQNVVYTYRVSLNFIICLKNGDEASLYFAPVMTRMAFFWKPFSQYGVVMSDARQCKGHEMFVTWTSSIGSVSMQIHKVMSLTYPDLLKRIDIVLNELTNN